MYVSEVDPHLKSGHEGVGNAAGAPRPDDVLEVGLEEERVLIEPKPIRQTDVGGLGIVYGRFSNDLQDSQRRARQLGSPVGIQRYEIALEAATRRRHG